ncbi:MAG: hypothetical protein ABIT58_02380, partial [Ferruginibacter sp.]
MSNNHKSDGNAFEDYLPDLSKKLGSDYSDHTITFPAQVGSGHIKNIMLEENFCVRYFNFSFKKDFPLDLFSQSPENERFYKLLFNLDSNSDHAEITEDDSSNFNANKSNVVLYSSDVAREGTFRKNTNYRRVLIIFSAQWLTENYTQASLKMDKLIQNLAIKNKSTIISENIDSQNRFIVSQLANELDKSSYAQIHIKTAAFILVNDILNKIVQRNRLDILSDQTLHYYTMLKVEALIMQSINQKLPNIDLLASEFNLSLSTLKRHFRIVYGKNIYQYY